MNPPLPQEVVDLLRRRGLDPDDPRLVVVAHPKPFDPDQPPRAARPRHPGRLEGWARCRARRDVSPAAWHRCHTKHWWAWHAEVQDDPAPA